MVYRGALALVALVGCVLSGISIATWLNDEFEYSLHITLTSEVALNNSGDEDLYVRRVYAFFDDGTVVFSGDAEFVDEGPVLGPEYLFRIPGIVGILLAPGCAMLSIPAWTLITVFVAVPCSLLVFRIWRRRWRTKRGCCVACGYNLAGNTTGRCPECGAVVSPLIGEAADGE